MAVGPSEFAPFGGAPLPNAAGVLRVSPGREGLVGEQAGERGHEPSRVAGVEVGGEGLVQGPHELDAVPQTAVREEMVVLPLVPRAVVVEPVPDVPAQPTVTIQPPAHLALASQQAPGGREGDFVPHLSVRSALVISLNERRAGGEDAFAQGRRIGGRPVARYRFEQRHRMAQIEQPDGLEVRAEERSRRAEHVVGVGPLVVSLGVRVEDARGKCAVPRLPTQRVQGRRMDGPLGRPELRAHGPPLVVRDVVIRPPAAETPVRVRLPRVEFEQRAVLRTTAAKPREPRLALGDGQRAVLERLEFPRKPVGECGEGREDWIRPRSREGPARLKIDFQQRRCGMIQGQRLAHRDDSRRVHCDTVTSSPRRSIVTCSSRRDSP